MIKLGMMALLVCCFLGNAQADIRFNCQSRVDGLRRDIPKYLLSLGIPIEQFALATDAEAGIFTVTLTTPVDDMRTLDFSRRTSFSITTEPVRLPRPGGGTHLVRTVSRKEIALALLQHGRVTAFAGEACSPEALADEVGRRQNIVAWAEDLNWIWPNGGPASWNSKYWRSGATKPGVPLHSAVMDAFIHQNRYAIGCYTATKLVMMQGVLDYYRRVKKDAARARQIEDTLLIDGAPLVGVEPGRMWSFETDFDPADGAKPGKLLDIQTDVAAGNFIPGDWVYLLNTDAATYQKTGYEGSNAIYMGRNLFDDYYNDHRHRYTYEQKLDEVYQWRNGVFSRSRDARKIKPLSSSALASLGNTPAAGGIQLDIRVSPRNF